MDADFMVSVREIIPDHVRMKCRGNRGDKEGGRDPVLIKQP